MKVGDLVKINGAVLTSDGKIGIVIGKYPDSKLYVEVFFPDTGKTQFFHKLTLEVISESG
jgi:hypothetical protein